MIKISPFLYLTPLLFVQINCAWKIPVKSSISGEIKNLSSGFLQLFLEEDINRKKIRLIAQIPPDKNGYFQFKDLSAPHVYTLKINDEKSIMLAVDKGQNIIINGDALRSNEWKISGSTDTDKLLAYEKFRKESLDRLVNTVRNEIKKLQGNGTPGTEKKLLELTNLEIENYKKHKDELIEFIKNEMGTSIAIYPTSIRWDGEKNFDFIIELATQFELAHPNTDVSARVNEKVRVLTANRIGGKVQEIVIPDKNGNNVSLGSLNAKYILIDFWASWCIPCRRESPLLVELYKKYRSKGLEIYSIGMDTEKQTWIKAIERDKRTWINVSNFQEFKAQVTFDYSVTALPANFLIDRSGKLIAKNLHGEDLENEIEKLYSK